MELKIKELENHIQLIRKNSMESVDFLLYHLLSCLDEKKSLEDDILGTGKAPVRKRDVKVQTIETSKTTNDEDDKDVEKMKLEFDEELARKDQELQQIREKLKELTERNEQLELQQIKYHLKMDWAAFMHQSLQLNKEFEDVTKEIRQVKNSAAFDKLVKENNRKDVIVSQLQKQLKDSQQDNEALMVKSEELEVTKRDNEILRKELEEFHKKQDATERDNQSLREELEELRKKQQVEEETKDIQTEKERNIIVRGCHRVKKRCVEFRDTVQFVFSTWKSNF